jgi:RNA-directed DNA polymerase
VSGTKADAEALREEIAGVLSTMGLRLSEEKTLITHIDEGLDFLGWHIQRRRKRGTNRRYVYTYPSHRAVKAVTSKVKTRCRQNTNLPLETLLRQLNPVLRGWTTYFRPGVSSIAFGYPARLHLATGHPLATPQAPRNCLEGTPATLLHQWMVARRQ